MALWWETMVGNEPTEKDKKDADCQHCKDERLGSDKPQPYSMDRNDRTLLGGSGFTVR